VALVADGNLESVEVPKIRQAGGGTGSKGTSPKSLDSVPGAGKITVTDKGQGDDDFQGDLSKVAAAMLNIRFQAMTDESLKVQRDAGERFRTGDTEGAMNLLEDFLLKLPEAQLDGEKVGMLRRPVESRLQKYKLMAAQTDMDRQATSKKPLTADQ